MLHVDHSNLTGGNMDSKITDLQPLFNQVEVILSGKPTSIACPVGKGIHFTSADRFVYRFLVSEPWPCPFNINQCPSGFTLSFWFKWYYIPVTYYIHYISMGNTFSVYKREGTGNCISLRWNVAVQTSWYHCSRGNPGEWNLVTWKVNHTHSVGYLNGLKTSERMKETDKNFPNDISNELHFNKNLNAGKFSVGPIQLWAGGKSPVFIWRLFQEGLNDYDLNWGAILNPFML